MSILDFHISEKEKVEKKIKRFKKKKEISIYFVFLRCGQTFSLFTLLMWGLVWRVGGTMDVWCTCVKHICRTEWCVMLFHVNYIYTLFWKWKNKHGKLFIFCLVYMYIFIAQILFIQVERSCSWTEWLFKKTKPGFKW